MSDLTAPAQPPGFDVIAELAAGEISRIDLCRVLSGPQAGALVAVKRLRPELATDADAVVRFRDEMWMAAALDHPHVVRVLGWVHDGQGLYLAVEFVRGVSLARLMRTVFTTGEHFSDRFGVYLGQCVASALAAAHEARGPDGQRLELVHRELTPENVLLGVEGEIKITDFGLAKARQRLSRTLPNARPPAHPYLSPEQVVGGQVDGRSDIFALGVVLFELFAQRLPWGEGAHPGTAIWQGVAAHLRDLCPRLDGTVVGIVHRCLEPDPAARYQTATELHDRLQGWLLAHGYCDNAETAGHCVRRNAMRQLRALEAAIVQADRARAARAVGPHASHPGMPSPDGHASPSPGPSRPDLGPAASATTPRAAPTVTLAAVTMPSPPDPVAVAYASTPPHGWPAPAHHDPAALALGLTQPHDYANLGLPAPPPAMPGSIAAPDPEVPPLPRVAPPFDPPADFDGVKTFVRGDEGSTLRRVAVEARLREAAEQWSADAARLTEEARQALGEAQRAGKEAEHASVSAQRSAAEAMRAAAQADAAAQAAAVVCERAAAAVRAAELVREGLEQAARGDLHGAGEKLRLASKAGSGG